MIILERLSGKFAILEIDGVATEIERENLVGDIKEGSVLTKKNGKYFLDLKATKTRREKLAGLQDSLFD